MIFCTLFDSNYLDRGLVMFSSLKDLHITFKLYVLAMDDKCFEVLSDVQKNNKELIAVSLNEFLASELNTQLKAARQNRTAPEFCWTCTPFIIDYVLTCKNEKICTYIDADMYFYSNPQCLLDEMNDNKSIQIVEHRFSNSFNDQKLKEHSGTYCVQFNTFKNSPEALELLRWWENQCIESCCSTANSEKKTFGDQKYLEGWEAKPEVSILQNLGGGVAPWNVNQYKLCENASENHSFILCEKKTGKKFELVFYHYHYITYIEPRKVNINVYGRNYYGYDCRLINALYIPYLKKLDEMKNFLRKNYGFYPILYVHPAFIGHKAVRKSFIARLMGLNTHKVINKLLSIILRHKYERKNIMEF